VEIRWRGKKESAAAEVGGGYGGSTIGGGEELAGVARPGSTSHGSRNGWYREKAEAKAITTMPLARPRKARCGTRHGRQWRELTEAHRDSPRGHY
jgi:hypothetical protein